MTHDPTDASRPTRPSRWPRLLAWFVPRFSMRTMMIAMTLICVTLGVWCERAERQRRAREEFGEVGGRTYFADWPKTWPELPEWLAEFRGGHYLRSIHRAALTHSDDPAKTAEGLSRLAHFPALTELELQNSSIDTKAAKALGALTTLKKIDLSESNLNDETIGPLASLRRLEDLDLEETFITNEGLRALSGLTNLRKLSLQDTSVDDEGLVHLARLTRLQNLTLWETRVAGPGLVHVQGARGLKHLDLDDSLADDRAMEWIAPFANLETLYFSNCNITDTGLARLAGLTKLTLVDLSGTEITSASVPAIAKWSTLKNLMVQRTALHDADFLEFAKLSALEQIEAEDTALTPETACELLRRSAKLQSVNEDDENNINRDLVEQIDQKKPFSGGEFSFKGKLPDSIWKGLADQTALTELGVSGSNLNDDRLAGLTGLQSLTHLEVMRCPITDRAAESIAKLKKLDFVDLEGTKLTDAGLAQLVGLKLTHLDLHNCPGITDAAIDSLLQIKSLTKLRIGRTRITEEGIARLAALPALTSLEVDSPWLGRPPVEILRRFKKLESFDWGDVDLNDTEKDVLLGRPLSDDCVLSDRVTLTPDIWRRISEATQLTDLRLDGHPVTDEDFALLDGLAELNSISLNNTKVGKATLVRALRRTGLRVLRIAGVAIASDDLQGIEKLDELTTLDLSRTQVDAAGLAHLAKCPKLTMLRLNGLPISLEDLAALGDVRQHITELSLSDTRVSPADVPNLLRQFPKLEKVEIEGETIEEDSLPWLRGDLPTTSRHVSLSGRWIDDQIAALLGSCEQLVTVRLRKTSIGEATLARIAKGKHLRELTITDTTLTDEAFAVAKHWRQLRELNLSRCELRGDTLRHIEEGRDLLVVDLSKTPVDDSVAIHLARFPRLKELDLSGTRITDETLRQLTGLRHLGVLNVSDTVVTESGLNAIRTAIPRCQIIAGNTD